MLAWLLLAVIAMASYSDWRLLTVSRAARLASRLLVDGDLHRRPCWSCRPAAPAADAQRAEAGQYASVLARLPSAVTWS